VTDAAPSQESAPPNTLAELTERLWARNAQLEEALQSRIVIEQAKGILAERFGLGLDEAFALLRQAARSHRIPLRTLAAAVVSSETTPPEILHVREAAARRAEAS
jgi:AmiR/NasT family two-component response regulator